jgi:hypothetical protein
MKTLSTKVVAVPCNFAGPCSWRYFERKCLHPKATGAKCPSAYKVKQVSAN